MARTPDETKKPARKPAAPRAGKPRDNEAAAPRGRAVAAPRAEAPSRPRVSAKPRAAEAPAPRGRAAAAPRAEAPSRPRVSAKPRAAEAPAPRPRVTKGSPSFERPAAAPAKPKPRATTAVLRAQPKAKPTSAAKPAAPKRAASKSARAAAHDPGRLDRLVEAARKSLDDDKAENIVILDVTNRASYADRLIIATGFVGRQIEAMAAHLDQALAAEGLKLRRNAIESSEDWVLINAGDLIIHLFTPEGRLKFDLEKMWGPDSPLGEAAPGEQSPI
ncbi:ribosome silencing factor [Sediminicoccus sp. KRV36]|uniref:ribosome silencing factor n=1 Tax=Sediminicoccus sp. KRV36 TaxID=3133721 RepID=UPI00200CE6D1|nr:ribosome silencing factor [Sediminicoccus rosea]UPY38106.1 ribosome silencing factor [Sediminicoccus rosea]